MSLSSEILTEEPPHYGFWQRLSAGVVSATAAFWAFSLIFVSLAMHQPNLVVYQPRPTPLEILDEFAGPTWIAIAGVLVLGYPIERFWVKTTDTGVIAAGKYALLFSVLLVLGAILGMVTGGQIAVILNVLIFITTGITASVGRWLYSRMVEFKFAMYVSAGVIATAQIASLVHRL